jgi:hypothetical protein
MVTDGISSWVDYAGSSQVDSTGFVVSSGSATGISAELAATCLADRPRVDVYVDRRCAEPRRLDHGRAVADEGGARIVSSESSRASAPGN